MRARRPRSATNHTRSTRLLRCEQLEPRLVFSATSLPGNLNHARVLLGGNLGGLQDPALAALVQKLDADGSLDRADMIQILTSVGTGGRVSATDLSDLKKILADAAQYNMPGYVQVLVGDVVNGNPANAHYQGAAWATWPPAVPPRSSTS